MPGKRNKQMDKETPDKGAPDKENPEWSDAMFSEAQSLASVMPDVVEALKRGPGRPPAANPKQHIGMRLDEDVVAWLRAQKGYNALVNEALREKMEGRV